MRNENTHDELPAMTWDRFWELVGTLGGPAVLERCDHLQEACERLSARLARGPADEITGFGERLAEALYRLDRAESGRLPVEGAGGPYDRQTDDHFLYARAAVVAAGREAYEGVLGRPERFAPYTALQAEELLYVHEEAYEAVTGEEWDHPTRYDYESCSNAEGWPGPEHPAEA
ncbi:DUF4240 domain-containing protein [Streptomyces sp. SP17BM10]|uniref:DUF4240 domain-containing protein n=1 Tax=Streptomyces sp. SP17BM10 TaxID=3002530 RepID=UPI002E7827F4|nr:DUF4240 domain-containing protein [Streptomyces sp. SP17BM10]MEE1782551.1 DUF4240 domain-containing protein [Streptomyces sp. SP17BM10]